MKKIMQSLMAVGFLCGVAACNTVDGAGKDVEYIGERVQEASETVKEELNE